VTDSRNRRIDSLRGLAALAVLGFHVWLYARPVPGTERVTALDYVWAQGRLGYVLFFALSGFLLYLPWLRAARGEGDRPPLGDYLRRRAVRILPGYYVALLGSIALLWNLASTPGVRLPPAESLPLFFVFGENFTGATVMKLNPPMWTLAVEVSFYLALPLIGLAAIRLAGGRRRQLVVPIGLIALGLAWNGLAELAGLGLPGTKVLPAMLPYFGAGMLAAVMVASDGLGRRAAGRALLGGASLVLLDFTLHAGLVPGSGNVVAVVHDLPAALGFAAIVAVAGSSSIPLPGLDSRATAWLGTVSYGLYLWNIPVLLVLRSMDLLPLGSWLAVPVVLGPSLVIAAISWYVFERPAIEWARRAGGKRRRKAARARPAFAESGS
jgi:peptidoglycan/LPS O-acetylase OafA/YrhL